MILMGLFILKSKMCMTWLDKIRQLDAKILRLTSLKHKIIKVKFVPKVYQMYKSNTRVEWNHPVHKRFWSIPDGKYVSIPNIDKKPKIIVVGPYSIDQRIKEMIMDGWTPNIPLAYFIELVTIPQSNFFDRHNKKC